MRSRDTSILRERETTTTPPPHRLAEADHRVADFDFHVAVKNPQVVKETIQIKLASTTDYMLACTYTVAERTRDRRSRRFIEKQTSSLYKN